MKRIAFFAHYDRDNVIDDYVIYYLRGLKTVTDKIVFASDCPLPPSELDKLYGLAEIAYADRHREYDFGSWKRCFEHLNYDLSAWDEVIIVNDSCFAPVFPFETVFEKMNAVDCDFWGPSATQVDGEFLHLCSYFIVFRKPVLSDESFSQFWREITPLKSKEDIVETYEIGLSRLLSKLGHRWGSYIPIAAPSLDWKTEYVQGIIPNRYPWVKVRLFRENPFSARGLNSGLRRIGKYYPRELVDAHMIRVRGTDNPPHYHYRRSVVSNYSLGYSSILSLTSKVKRNKKRTSVAWWKIYVYLFRFPIFALAFPLFWLEANQ